MAREGVAKSKKKISHVKHGDPTSNRSKSRAKRGFKSLEQSSRMHKRMNRRMIESRSYRGKVHEPGAKFEITMGSMVTAGGATKYH